MRHKPPVTRTGNTRKLMVADVELYVTVNPDERGYPREMFCKVAVRSETECKVCAERGSMLQGMTDRLCTFISLYLQCEDSKPETAVQHLRHQRFPPLGIVGQPKSIADALAVVLEEYVPST